MRLFSVLFAFLLAPTISFADVRVIDGDTITGAIVESKAGREAILAKRVIDATGDADVAHRAGAPTVMNPTLESNDLRMFKGTL